MEYVILIPLLIILLCLCVFGVFMVYMLIRTGVPFIPTHDDIISAMISAVAIGDNQKIYELGCGNGKMMFAIKKHADGKKLKNIRITGYELIKPLTWFVNLKKKLMKPTTNTIEIFSRDFFRSDISEAGIIFCYLFPHIMQRISCEIWPTLKSGTILVSHAFKIDDIEPINIIKAAGTTLYVYRK